MKNFLKSGSLTVVDTTRVRLVVVRLLAALALSCAMGVGPQCVSQAQRRSAPVKVSKVGVEPVASGTVVSIEADGTLSTGQSWQDKEGYHLVLPNTGSLDSLRPGRGVKLRQVGTSLEVLLETQPGAKVNVQSADHRLNLVVDHNLEGSTSSEERLSSTAEDVANSRRTKTANSQWPNLDTLPVPPPEITSGHGAPGANGSDLKIEPEDDGLLASIFSGTSVLVVMALGLFGLLVSRKFRSRETVTAVDKTPHSEEDEWGDKTVDGKLRLQDEDNGEFNASLGKSGEPASTIGSSRPSVNRLTLAGPTSLYGAYRIDQEVGKLILGQPHRIDVLASRAIDDRRAIETSLVRGLNSPELDEKAQRRAREALEEYGFVARQCAALLLAPDAFDRTTAARCLGEIKSPAALPFLLEGLYDSESIVRNQAVISIGELRLPSAIGALLDIARTHPDVPSALLSRTLSACSVEGLDFFDSGLGEPTLLGTGQVGSIIDEITHLEPLSSVEDLPADSEDESAAHALLELESKDIEQRSAALTTLAQFRVQRAVDAMVQVARHDPEPNLRSIAIASLGSINHESVFPAILIGMADDSREVRASAARSLNRLSFDRADAYVRVIETGDDETIHNVAKACIQAGIVAQNLDRLSNSDHRQAYETFSLICLIAKAKMNEPVLNTITDHPNLDVRLKAVHLLACTGQPETFEQLRELADSKGLREEVKTALLEAMYKLEQSKADTGDTPEAVVGSNEPPVEVPEAKNLEAQINPDFAPEFEPEVKAEVHSDPKEFDL